jgi:hypothetical protein
MPIYFGYKPAKDQKVSPSLTSIGVNLIQAAPSRVHTFFTQTVRTLQFQVFLSFISEITFRSLGTGAKSVVSCLKGFIPRNIDVLPFELPTLALAFTEISEEAQAELFAAGYFSSVIQGITLYIKNEPSLSDIRRAITIPGLIKTARVPQGMLNIDGFASVIALIRLASVLSHTMRRAQFMTKEELNEASGTVTSVVKRKAEGSTAAEYEWNDKAYTSKRFKLSDYIENGSHALANAYTFPIEAKVSEYKAPRFISVGSEKMDIDDKKAKVGITFPFVQLLSLGDSGVVDIIERHFSGLLGATAIDQANTISTLRSSWGIIKDTRTGHYLAHYFKCCEIAISAGCSIRAIFSGDFYDGCSMVGMGWTGFVNGDMFEALSASDFNEELRSIATHQQVLDSIRKIMGATAIGKPIEGMMDLHQIVLKAKLGSDDLEKVRSLAASLRFPQKSLPASVDNLVRMVRYISGGEPLPIRYPIGSDALGSKDRVTVSLSGFGRTCPSFLVPGGTMLDLTKDMPGLKTESVRNKKGKEYVKVLNPMEQVISVRMVNLVSAISDMKTVIEKKMIRVGLASKGDKGGAFVKVFRKDDRGALWNALSGIVNAGTGNKAGLAGVDDGLSAAAGAGKGKEVQKPADLTDLI